MPIPPDPPLPLPDAAGAEGFAASLGVREPRKYQTPTTMPARRSIQSHQRLLDGLAADASVVVWLAESGRSINLSCPIHLLLTNTNIHCVRASQRPKEGPSRGIARGRSNERD